MSEIDDLRAEVSRLRKVLDGAWRKAVAFPRPHVCKHLIASNILSDMETLGFDVPYDLAKAVVEADDETALAWGSLTMKEHS